MAEDGLLPWAFGAFHAALITAGVVAALHATGGLGDTFQRIGTGPGTLLFLALWALSWAAARRTLRGHDLFALGPGAGGALLARAAMWGGVAGAAFVGLTVAALGLASGGGAGSVAFAALAAVAGLVGGMLVGAALGALDAALLALALAATEGPGGQTFKRPPQV